MLINKLILFFLVLINSLLSLTHRCDALSNIALNKPYTLSQDPNYAKAADASDRTALTDGKFSTGYFWTQKTTVGWQGTQTVEILIDLERVYNIKSIRFNTARGDGADVFFTAHIYAFTGTDRNHFAYVGDLAATEDNAPGKYQVRMFTLDGLRAGGRYVLLEVVVRGNYLFCDEIEVIEGDQTPAGAGSLTLDGARKQFQSLRMIDVDKELLRGQLQALKSAYGPGSDPASFDALLNRIGTVKSADDAAQVMTAIYALRGRLLAGRFPGKQLHVEAVSPWGAFPPLRQPANSGSAVLSFTMMQNGYDYGALAVTNLAPGTASVKVTVAQGTPDGPTLQVYEVPYIKTYAMEYVADPLQKTAGDIPLRFGETRLIFIVAQGRKPGRWPAAVNIAVGGIRQTINVATDVLRMPLPDRLSLNSVNWGYLDFNLIKNNQEEAVRDLFSHHTNVIVVPPSVIPSAESDGKFDFASFGKYVTKHKGADKLLVYMSFISASRSTFGNRYGFMEPQWRDCFKRWYRGVLEAASQAGFSRQQIYIYPFDEMQGEQVDKFIRFAGWVRSELPEIKLFATINTRYAEAAIPYLNVTQIHSDNDVATRLRGVTTEFWFYETQKPAKSMSPYSYYRLLAWRAFVGGFKGIGFWAYADSGRGANGGTAWDDFDGIYPDYAVIYDDQGHGLVSSRRWEAWRMGLEDYELLTIYAGKKGDAAAKTLVRSVLENPSDTERADQVRRRMLAELGS